jgi:hypothetical protein
MDEAARQLESVRLALRNGIINCIHWRNEYLIWRVRADSNLQGLTPEAIVELLIRWVRDEGVEIRQKRETREIWRDEFDFVYDVLVPVDGLPRDLYLELILHDEDVDYPEVTIVSCHLTSFPRGPK